MKRTKKVGSTGRFGARYGTQARKRTAQIEKETRVSSPCPRCRSKKVFRVSIGIWQCKKCNLKFAGGAFKTETASGKASKRIAQRLAKIT
ncbi:MAG: 50S ribosomal protein L37ae [Candidatus Heimdallarchaeota archaeon]